ncbi:MAG: and a Fis-type DNA-binding domains/DNA-binding protein Fis (factor for inversion stimulation) [Verrucomicrobia bacterium]|nr:MAG: and a Fis-type DNA-binding domains/DNA-binding protein Fis (factor for inversion stimulation) [Verrucomicrobiota bacterium]
MVIDDERPVLMTLDALLTRRGFSVQTASTAAGGLQAVGRWKPDLVLLDLGLPDGDGLDVLREVRTVLPAVQVLILTANDSLANAIQSIKLGAFHFISKPYAPEELMSLMGRALDQKRLEQEAVVLREESARLVRRLAEVEERSAPVFHSRSMRQLEDLLKRVAPTDANVLLLGESGVGKEVLANRLHGLSRRAGKAMVKLNCAAFPANMIEGELFGYVKGAFTGAVSDFAGLISQAEGGTLFLDEVAEMPPELQTRFLRVLQEREYRQLGGLKTVKADFRLVAATNRPVAEAMRTGALRQDLYYRLNTFQVEIPPLRERREDIPALVQRFVAQFSARHGLPLPKVQPEALERLRVHPWPGNIRELQNAIEYAVVLAEAEGIGIKQLPADLRVAPVLHSALGEAANALDLESRERQAVLQVLIETGGNKKRAAEILGIQRPTLYAKLRKYGVH